jgi:hypothetical protein
MTTRAPLHRLLPAVLGLAAVCAGAPAPASARAFPSQPTTTALVLTVSRGDVVSPDAQVTTLDCDDHSGGSHPAPAEACAALTEAGGDLDRLKGQPDTVCLAHYDPVTATAEGTWQGIPVKWSRTFGNSCHLRTGTGPVF